MAVAASRPESGSSLIENTRAAVGAMDALLADATRAVRTRVAADGRVSAKLVDKEQRAAHGLAWFATYAEALRQLAAYAERMSEAGRFGELEELLVRVGFGEFLAQMLGGIPMSQGEMVRPGDLGLTLEEVSDRVTPEVEELIATGNTAENRARLADLMREHHGATVGDCGLDETLEAIRDEMRKFAESEVVPHAHEWHLTNSYIPLDVIAHMADLGVFGLTIPEEYGGMGLGKESMCVVSEELVARLHRRGVARHALRNRRRADPGRRHRRSESEMAAEDRVRRSAADRGVHRAEHRLRSRLAQDPRREADGDVYKVSGNKTWITHPVRADLMTLLVRTDPKEPGYRGLSMLLAEKPRGTDEDPFPAPGMSGGEIEVLGYRGMKEYEIGFDGFEVKAENLLGGAEGQGFKQLMQTFEFGAHPDRGARGRRGAGRDGAGAPLCGGARPVRREAVHVSARRRQDRHDGGRGDDRAADHLFRGAAEGFRPALRSRSRHGEALGGARRLGRRRQRGADPRRQRLRAGISGVARAVRRAHPQHFRGRSGNSGASHRPKAAGRLELSRSAMARRLPDGSN